MQNLILKKIPTVDNAHYHRVYLSRGDCLKLDNILFQNKTFNLLEDDPINKHVNLPSMARYVFFKGQILEFVEDHQLPNDSLAVNSFLRAKLDLTLGESYDLELVHWGLVQDEDQDQDQ